jgi:hypothetical protein
MPVLELIVGLIGKIIPVIIESVKASQLTPEEKISLLARIGHDLEAAKARVAAVEIREV